MLDLTIVAVFLLVAFAIGIFDRKKVTLDDYWVNSRRTNKFALVATVLSTFIGAGAIIGNAGIAFAGGGLATLVIAGSYFFYFFIFAKFFAHKIKEFGDKYNAYTLPDFLEVRYSNKVRLIGALVNLVSRVLSLSVQMLAVGIFVSALTSIDATLAIIIGGGIVVLYTTIGGLRADIRIDVFQFFIMLFLLLIFLPILMTVAGGLQPITRLPLSYLIGQEFAPMYVLVIAFFFLGAETLTAADMWQRVYAGDSAKNVKWVFNVSSLIVALLLIAGTLFGIYGHILLPDSSSNLVVPHLLQTYLPAGLFGLVIAGFFATFMSSADTVLLTTSMTIVHDLYQKACRKQLSDEQVLKISRWTTFVVGALAVVIAALVFNIVHLAIEAVSFYVVMLPAIVFGFYGKTATNQAAWWSMIAGLVVLVVFMFIDPVQAFIPGLISSAITFILVNKFSKEEQKVYA